MKRLRNDAARKRWIKATLEALPEGTSLLDEFNKKNTNSAADVAKAEKSFAQFRLELGERLIPIYVKLLQYGVLILASLRALPAFVSENRVAFGLLAVAVLFQRGELGV